MNGLKSPGRLVISLLTATLILSTDLKSYFFKDLMDDNGVKAVTFGGSD
jgi:hypothetical protein